MLSEILDTVSSVDDLREIAGIALIGVGITAAGYALAVMLFVVALVAAS